MNSETDDLSSILDSTSLSSDQPAIPYECSESSELALSKTTYPPSKATTISGRREYPVIRDLIQDAIHLKEGEGQDQTETESRIRFRERLQKIEEDVERWEEDEEDLNEKESIYLLGEMPKLEYEVRGYQAEIYMKSKDRNSIIVLETGSGKTIISILHILESLRKYGNTKMVRFFSWRL